MQVSMQIALLERRSISELQEIWKKYFDAPLLLIIRISTFPGLHTAYRNLPMVV